MRPPYAERHFLARLAHLFAQDHISEQELEQRVEHVLRGGFLNDRGEPLEEAARGSALAAEYERERRNGLRAADSAAAIQRPGQAALKSSGRPADELRAELEALYCDPEASGRAIILP